MRDAADSRELLTTRLLAGPAPDLIPSLSTFKGSIGSKLANQAVKLIASTAGGNALYTPVYLYGVQGCGKTRLLNGLANQLRTKAVPFVHLDGAALQVASRGATHDLAIRIRNILSIASVAILDDVNKLMAASCGKEICQALIDMASRRRHVVLTSDRPVTMLEGFPESFERLLWGGIELVLEPTDQDSVPDERRRGPGASSILRAVSSYYRIPVAAIIGKRRTAPVAKARHVAMYLLRTLREDLSFPDIGRILENRDHTTIMHGTRKIEHLLGKDHDLAHDISAIKRALGIAVTE